MELTAGFPCALLSVEGFKASDLIREIRMEAQMLKPVGVGSEMLLKAWVRA